MGQLIFGGQENFAFCDAACAAPVVSLAVMVNVLAGSNSVCNIVEGNVV